MNRLALMFVIQRLAAVSLLSRHVSASWGGSSSSDDTSIYANNLNRDWLYDGSTISLQLQGCMWGVVADNEDAGCLEDSSEDGTTYWYQMANCRRAQAVYNLYSGSSCSSSNFKESFVSLNGVSEFVYYLTNDGGYYDNGEDGDYYDDDDGGGGYDGDSLPMCEQVNGYYVGVGCADDGTFALLYFDDAYCLQPTGSTYDSLRSFNRQLRSYKSCATVYKNGGNGDGAVQNLIGSSESCSSLDSSLCSDNSIQKNRHSHTSTSYHIPGVKSIGNKTWLTKLKYVVAGLLLVASFVMFTGILFTNRRRRRALMQRKYRQSKRRKSSKSRSSRPKSKSRDDRSSREKSSSRRSKSKSHAAETEEGAGEAGIFT